MYCSSRHNFIGELVQECIRESKKKGKVLEPSLEQAFNDKQIYFVKNTLDFQTEYIVTTGGRDCEVVGYSIRINSDGKCAVFDKKKN